MTLDPITLADEAEERSAADALRAAANSQELGAAWAKNCEHFQGRARNLLMTTLLEKLRELGAMQG